MCVSLLQQVPHLPHTPKLGNRTLVHGQWRRERMRGEMKAPLIRTRETVEVEVGLEASASTHLVMQVVEAYYLHHTCTWFVT